MKNSGALAGRWLHFLGIAGLVLSLILFLLYSFGLVPATISPTASAEKWNLSVDEYLGETGSENGSLWMFARIDGYGLSTAALAILASASFPVLLILLAYWLRRKDWIYAAMAFCICAVLTIAILS